MDKHPCDRCGAPHTEEDLQLPANVQIDDEFICPKCFARSLCAQQRHVKRRKLNP